MTRVTNQKVRQYMLETGEALDLMGPLPDKIQLFNAEGEPMALTGVQLYAGPGEPDISVGVVGDFWIDTVGNTLWEKVEDDLAPETGVWEQIALLSGIPPGFKGAWASGTTYVPGDIVRHLGKTYGTVTETTGNDPTDQPANWGPVGDGVQATTLDKVDDGVAYTKNFNAGSRLYTPSTPDARAIPLAVDFVGSAANLTFDIDNQTADSLSMRVYQGGVSQSLTGLPDGSNVSAGAHVTRRVNFGTFYGDSGDLVVLLFGDGDTSGDVVVTVTGGSLVAPTTPSPWTKISDD